MSKKSPTEPAKNFNMNTVKKGQDKKTEYIVSKKSNGVKYWKILKSEEKKCLKEFEKKKKINLEEYKIIDESENKCFFVERIND